jgi:hypothetical protein
LLTTPLLAIFTLVRFKKVGSSEQFSWEVVP